MKLSAVSTCPSLYQVTTEAPDWYSPNLTIMADTKVRDRKLREILRNSYEIFVKLKLNLVLDIFSVYSLTVPY
jgi:hypothetical protein